MIPTINTKGVFTFLAPYDTLLNSAQELTVTSIRSIPELQASGEDPLNNIYIPVGETDATLLNDIKAEVPIVTLRTEGGEYFYIPANKLKSGAKLTGVKYVEKSLIVNLGYLPVATDLTLAIKQVNDSVYSTLGVVPDIIPTDTSATLHVDETKHATMEAVRANQKTIDKSWETRYNELLALYNAQQVFIANIEQVYRTNGIAG